MVIIVTLEGNEINKKRVWHSFRLAIMKSNGKRAEYAKKKRYLHMLERIVQSL